MTPATATESAKSNDNPSGPLLDIQDELDKACFLKEAVFQLIEGSGMDMPQKNVVHTVLESLGEKLNGASRMLEALYGEPATQ